MTFVGIERPQVVSGDAPGVDDRVVCGNRKKISELSAPFCGSRASRYAPVLQPRKGNGQGVLVNAHTARNH